VSALPPSLERAIGELMRLPGVGRKTAVRLAFHLLEGPHDDANRLAAAILEMREKVRPCSRCFHLSEEDLCAVCSDPSRDTGLLCVVEDSSAVLAFERTRALRGVYHVLGGALSPIRDVGPGELRVRELLERIRGGGVREVILATSPNVEGEATAVYLSRLLKPEGVAVSRLAQGLPAGSELEYADELTLQRAIEGRRDY
jgi:recombination protein RecR